MGFLVKNFVLNFVLIILKCIEIDKIFLGMFFKLF